MKRADAAETVELHLEIRKCNGRVIRLYKKHGLLKEYLLLERRRKLAKICINAQTKYC